VRWRDFLLGTVIGLVPGVATTSLFIDRAAAAIRDPGAGTFALLGAAAAAILGLVWVLRRKLRDRGIAAPVPAAAPHGS
jgi:phospholipase D1/2